MVPWHLISLLLIASIPSIHSKYKGLPSAINHISLESYSKNDLYIRWRTFESDLTAVKIQTVNLQNGTLTTEYHSNWTDYKSGGLTIHMEPNVTYKVRVSVFNQQGEGPLSPDLYYHNRPDQSDYDEQGKKRQEELVYKRGNLNWDDPISFTLFRNIQKEYWNIAGGGPRPTTPNDLRVKWNSESRANLTWEASSKRRIEGMNHPIEYIFCYADTKDLSVWRTIRTNTTWIMMENLKNGTVYNAYVTARDGDLTSADSKIIPILAYEDMTGLPEPVITIEPSYKNGTFSIGDWIAVKCTISPNTDMEDVSLQLTVGSQEALSIGRTPLVYLSTTVQGLVDTATCMVLYSNRYNVDDPVRFTRTSTRTWRVLPSLVAEFAKRRQEEMKADRVRMEFRSI